MPDIFRFHVRQGFVEARGCRDRIAHADEQASDIFAREIAVLAAVDDDGQKTFHLLGLMKKKLRKNIRQNGQKA